MGSYLYLKAIRGAVELTRSDAACARPARLDNWAHFTDS